MSRAPAAPLITETIEKKAYTDQRAKTVLLEALRGKGGKLTHADAMRVWGLPGDETRRALGILLKEYRSHLGATESGELIYEFDAAFQRRDAVPLRERVARVGLVLWKGFSALFKVAIMATLVVYFTAFVAMLIALVFARSAGSDRDDDDGGGFGGLFWIWGWGCGGDVRPRLAWERIEPEPVLTGNSGERNAVIGFFNAFNLSAPLWIVPAFEAKFHLSLVGWGFFLQDFPLAFSGLFFGVPLLRWL